VTSVKEILDDMDEKLILLDKVDALRLVSSFFVKEWATTDLSAVHTSKITSGLINSLQLIWRDNIALTEPAAMLIRHFGRSGEIEEPKSTSTTLSAAQQAIVYWEMSRRGWGPEIYGFFPGGRLEEYFVGAHTLTAAESTQPEILRGIARSYARLHSLELPLRRDSSELITQELFESVQSKRAEVLRTLQTVDDPFARKYVAIFEATDWVSEMEWVRKLFKEHNCKITVTHGDTNHLNVLIKNADVKDRVVLIDYETVSYSYRGFDLGGHFTERMYCYNHPDTQLTGYSVPDKEEQQAFCKAYLQELQDLGEKRSEHETVPQIMLEATIGRLYHLLFTNMMCMVFDDIEVEPLFLSGLVHMMETYKQLKQEFERDH